MRCLNGCGEMSVTLYEGVQIDICKDCAGVWLDDSELATIVHTQERTWPPAVVQRVLELVGGMGIPDSEFENERSCPRCPESLQPVNYQGNSGVIVNTCPDRHGVWLDRGELAKIQIFMENWQKTRRD